VTPTSTPGLTADQIEAFAENGFVKVESAFPTSLAAQCEDLLWQQIDAEPDDPATWTQPVYWVGGLAGPLIDQAANNPRLHAAFDQLLSPGRWLPRVGLGSFPLRFPHPTEPDDAGWHIEGSYRPEGANWPYTNVYSRDRALLMLFLFTDVDGENAPTRIRVGSHLDVPAVLKPYGEQGVSGLEVGPVLDKATAHRPLAHATGKAGDVYLCHPFLVHAAQPHHGTRPRFIAQPPLHPREQITLDRADGAYSVVERTIRRGLGLPD
jgi:phytanoyl-CoA dioxygenase PhyH